MHACGERSKNGRGIRGEGAHPVPDGRYRPIHHDGNLPVAQPADNTQLDCVGDHRGSISPTGSKQPGQQDMGGTTVTAPSPARSDLDVHYLNALADGSFTGETPRPQPARAPGTSELTGDELGFDSGGIVAYREHSATRFALERPGAALETGTGSFVF